MKLWDKGGEIDRIMEDFTVGRDRDMDVRLARWDVVGSIAHASMLGQVGLLSADDAATLVHALSELLEEIDANGFVIDDGVEDVHSQVEKILVERCGDVGKRIHVGRSRNDQVALDMKLFLRHEMRTLRRSAIEFATLLLDCAERYQHLPLPGFTHFQVAMNMMYSQTQGRSPQRWPNDSLRSSTRGSVCAKTVSSRATSNPR